jgi:hypothetical protein
VVTDFFKKIGTVHIKIGTVPTKICTAHLKFGEKSESNRSEFLNTVLKWTVSDGFTTHLTLKYALRLQRHAAVRVEDDSAGERGLRAHGGDR